MTRSSFAARNVVSTYQKNLRPHPAKPMKEAEGAGPEFTDVLRRASARSLRERFGAEAVREFRSASLEGSRRRK